MNTEKLTRIKAALQSIVRNTDALKNAAFMEGFCVGVPWMAKALLATIERYEKSRQFGASVAIEAIIDSAPDDL